MKLFDPAGQQVELGTQLGRGGEGTVYPVTNHPGFVAKVYHTPPSATHAAKLAAMASVKTDNLLKIAAWPIGTLHSAPHGPVAGFVMPMVTGFRAIHNLYGPKTRISEFPSNASWTFLVHTAANLARAFAVVHQHGHVIGDVNHGNALVSPRAVVAMIDCDSFQIAAAGRQYLCEVGVSTHQPPELQSVPSFKGMVRTQNHDNFGLAVLIFQLLMMGRHPFSGKYLGSGDMQLERAIREYRFAYGRTAAYRQMECPPNVLSLESLSPPIVGLFERAFAPEGSRDGGRPSAKEWVAALSTLERQVKACALNPNHTYLTSLPSCPWCRIEASSGVVLFAIAVAAPQAGAPGFNLEIVWGQIVSVQPPGPAPALPVPDPNRMIPLPISIQVGRKRRKYKVAAVVVLVVGLGILVVGMPVGMVAAIITAWVLAAHKSPEHSFLERDLKDARERWELMKSRWQEEAGDAKFDQWVKDLEGTRAELEGLPAIRAKKLAQLQAQSRDRQFRRHLDRHRLAGARIPGIGPGRQAVLDSYGIETAADIDYIRIISIPGFGSTLAGNLTSWRLHVERRFTFNPIMGVDPTDRAALEREITVMRVNCEQRLSAGPSRLATIAQDAIAKRTSLQGEVEEALRALEQAEANWRAT